LCQKLRLGIDSFSDGYHREPFSRIESQTLQSSIISATCTNAVYVLTLPKKALNSDTTNAVKVLLLIISYLYPTKKSPKQQTKQI
jgi:hypothetical protein